MFARSGRQNPRYTIDDIYYDYMFRLGKRQFSCKHLWNLYQNGLVVFEISGFNPYKLRIIIYIMHIDVRVL
jgi:hypothetical protein